MGVLVRGGREGKESVRARSEVGTPIHPSNHHSCTLLPSASVSLPITQPHGRGGERDRYSRPILSPISIHHSSVCHMLSTNRCVLSPRSTSSASRSAGASRGGEEGSGSGAPSRRGAGSSGRSSTPPPRPRNQGVSTSATSRQGGEPSKPNDEMERDRWGWEKREACVSCVSAPTNTAPAPTRRPSTSHTHTDGASKISSFRPAPDQKGTPPPPCASSHRLSGARSAPSVARPVAASEATAVRRVGGGGGGGGGREPAAVIIRPPRCGARPGRAAAAAAAIIKKTVSTCVPVPVPA